MIISSFINLLSLQLNEYLQSELKQKLSSFEKIICITAIADKKIITVFFISGVCAPYLPQSSVQIK